MFVVVAEASEKVAPTVLFASMVTEHVPVPEQAPVHPLSWYPVLGVAVTVTVVPEVYPAEGWVGLAEMDPLVVPESVRL
jgi:hypothetical protein